MYGKYLGIDIGAESVKMALLKRGLREVTLLNTWQFRITEGLESIPDIISGALSDLNLPNNNVAISILSKPLSIRVLRFPFGDPKKVDMVYKFELESISTFDPQEKFIAYHLVKGLEKGSEAIVCMYEPEDVAEMMELIERAGLDPKMLTLSTIAMSTIDGYLGEEKPVVVVDIGASQIGYTLFDSHGMRRIRTSPGGGSEITNFVAKSLGVSFDEAEILKRTGLVGEHGSVVHEALSHISTDIAKTLHFFESELGTKVKELRLTGGTSMMPGLSRAFSEELKIPVSFLNLPELGNKTAHFLTAFALALYGSSSSRESLNLRKDQYAHSGDEEELKKTFTIPAALLLIIFIISFYGSCSKYFDLKDRVGNLQTVAEKSVKELFPDVPVIVNPWQYLQSEVSKIKGREELIESIVGGPRPLDLLKNISESIPPSIAVTLDEINLIDDKSARISGKVNTYDEVSQIEKALVSSKKFKDVRQDTTGSALKGRIQFQITVVF